VVETGSIDGGLIDGTFGGTFGLNQLLLYASKKWSL